MATLNVLIWFPEFPNGPVPEVGPYEQNKTSAACFGQKWLPVTSRVALRVQGVAAPYPAEDNAPQSWECDAEWEKRLCHYSPVWMS